MQELPSVHIYVMMGGGWIDFLAAGIRQRKGSIINIAN